MILIIIYSLTALSPGRFGCRLWIRFIGWVFLVLGRPLFKRFLTRIWRLSVWSINWLLRLPFIMSGVNAIEGCLEVSLSPSRLLFRLYWGVFMTGLLGSGRRSSLVQMWIRHDFWTAVFWCLLAWSSLWLSWSCICFSSLWLSVCLCRFWLLVCWFFGVLLFCSFLASFV